MTHCPPIQTHPIAKRLASLAAVLLLSATQQAESALIDSGNGLIHDTDQNITRTQDSNLFSPLIGNQDLFTKNPPYFALAVRPGEVAAVPVPESVWLFGSALMCLAILGRVISTPGID